MVQVESHKSTTLPNLQVAWDQTSLGSLLFCPRRYYYEHVLNYIPKHEAIELTFGRFYHSSIEAYRVAMASGKSFSEAQDAACDVALVISENWNSEDRYRNRFNLLRTVIWYTAHWGPNDPAQVIILKSGKPAVELSFRYELDLQSPDGSPYILTGHFDAVVNYEGQGLMVDELKTTKATLGDDYFKQFSPNLQVTWYFTAANIVLPEQVSKVLVDAAQVAVGFSDFRRHFAHRYPEHVSEFLAEVKYWIQQAEFHAESNFYPKNERNCFLCAFKRVCSAPPSVREAHLKDDFVNRVWNPLESR